MVAELSTSCAHGTSGAHDGTSGACYGTGGAH